jgi:COP9 signalosome complex subunit 4
VIVFGLICLWADTLNLSRSVLCHGGHPGQADRIPSFCQADEDWKGAADVLARIPLGSSQRNVSDEYKAKLYVRIAMLYLEDDDEVSADSYVARSHSIVGKADFTNLEV